MKRLLILIGILAGSWLASAQQLNRVEYFWDTDPGLGSGTALSVTTADSISGTFVVPTIGLTPGIHTLYVRSRQTNGSWSVFSKRAVHIQQPLYPIAAAEYFYDTDPGFGNGTPITITPGDSISLTQNFPTTGLQPGIHTLYVRVRTSLHEWSVFSKRLVHITEPDAGAVIAAEYFVDTDPGHGNGTAITITAGDSIDLIPAINTASLAPGIHTVYVRVKTANGAWSVFSKRAIHVQYPEAPEIVYAEYFVDTDPGFGSGTSISVTAGDSVETNFAIPTGALSEGLHMVYVRVKDANNQWSVFSKKLIYIDNPADDPIVQAEYFVDTDPGIGSATPISITQGDTVVANFQIPTNTLLIGSHVAYVRVKDSAGRWSVFSQDTFYVGNFNCAVYGNGEIEMVGDTCRGTQITFTDRAASNSGVNSNDYTREWDIFNDGTIDLTPDSVLNYTFNTPGTYTVKLTTKEIANNFCQETILKTFTIRNIDSTTVNVSICDGQSHFAGGANQTVQGTYYDVLNNRYGCDSVLTTNLTVITNVTPSVVLSTPNTSFCSGTYQLFTATPTNGGSLPYYTWKVNGNSVGAGYGYLGWYQYGFTNLSNNDIVTVELTSNETCTTVNPAVSNSIQVSVTPSVSASITIDEDVNDFCYGTTATFTVTGTTNPGSNPQYAWYRNNTLVQTGGTTYVSSDLGSGEFIRCYLSSDATCVNNSPVSSNIIYMTVYPVGAPDVTIGANQNSVCYGSSVVLSASASYQGNNPEYRWFLNGALVQSGSSNTYSNSALDDNDSIACVVVSDYQCRTANTDTSNSIIMDIIYAVPATVDLAYSDNDICDGQNVSFTATPSPFYGSETYTWYLNGQSVQSGTNRFYSNNTLDDEDSVWVVFQTSPLQCASGLPASSDTIHFTVTPNVTVDVTLAVNDDEICEGTNVTFTATPTNEGITPTYYWYINNTYQPGAGNGNTFSSNSLGNGNLVRVDLQSSIECAVNNPASSNAITMTVYDTLMPTAVVTASQTTICEGTQVDFSLVLTNEGSNPTIEWLVNGSVVQTGGLTFSSSTLEDFDQIRVRLTSDYVCPMTNPVLSNLTTMTVYEYVSPTVNLSIGPNPSCPGNLISLVATPFNGGTQPIYTFYKNNTIIQTGQQTQYTSTNFADGDVIYIVMESNRVCLNTPIDTSNIDTIRIQSVVTADVSISATSAQCAGSPITFTAAPVNGGPTPDYRWKVNSVLFQQGPDNTFNATGLSNGDVVICEMLSSLGCATNNPATSNSITIQFNSVVTPSVILAASVNNVCQGIQVDFTATPTDGGSTPTYIWRVNANVVQSGTSATYSSSSLNNNDVVSVEMTSSELCVSVNPVSDQITMTINQCVQVDVTLSAPQSVCEGDDIVLTATPVNGGATPNYEFFVSGISVQSGSSNQYTISNAQVGNYTAYVVLTSSLPNVTNNPATSNTTQTLVNASTPVSVSITESANNVCASTAITFTSSATNAGNNPVYTWYVNGNAVLQYNQPTYSGTFNDDDEVYVTLSSSEVCPVLNPAVSNTVTLNLFPTLPVSVSVAVDVNNFCSGTTATFIATPVNEGLTPSYTWYVNGNVVQTGSSNTYSSATLDSGDDVWCVLTSSEPCTSNNPATSNQIAMTVFQNLQADVSILSNYGSASCLNDVVSFYAYPVNGGTNPSYQWYAAGLPVPNSDNDTITITASQLGVVDVYVVMTSDYQCALGNPATSNTVNFTVSNALQPEVLVTSTATSICPGQSILFGASHINGGLTPAYQWFVNNVLSGTGSSFNYSSFNNGDSVYVVLTSSLSCATVPTDTSDMTYVSVTQTAIASVFLNSTATTICSGQSVTFFATAFNTGTAPVYNWHINGVQVQSGPDDFYTTTTLADGDSVSVEMISNDPCVAVTTVNADGIVMIVGNLGLSSVSITTPSTAICRGQSVVFTAIPVSGGSAPSYEWFVNGNSVQLSGSNTFTTNTLVDGDDVYVVMTSNDPCVTNQTSTSNQVSVTIGTRQASVSVNASATSVCVGQQVTVTATPVNGGSAAQYEWFVNGVSVLSGAQNSVTVPASVPGLYSVYVVMTSSDSCVAVQTVTSNSVDVEITTIQASVGIFASTNNVCLNVPITFTAFPTNGGNAPQYEWFVNSVSVQSSSATTYTSSGLQNGDVVTCALTSNDPCVAVQTVTSNAVTISIVQNLQASVSIVASDNNVCEGTNITFTASAVNEGSAPVYDFRVNGISVQSGSSNTYSAVFENGDVVTCVLTSSDGCVAITTVTSNAVTMTVNQPTPLSAAIVANPGTGICPGTNVLFTATSPNAGPNAGYTWTVNGVVVSSIATFQSSTLNDGDTVALILTSNATCLTTFVDTEFVVMNVGNQLIADVSIVSNGGSIVCSGTSVTFTATPINGGSNPAYQWKVNGIDVGFNINTYTTNSLQDGDSVWVILTSNNGCVGNPVDTSNLIYADVVPLLTPAVFISATDDSVCSGTSVTYTATGVNSGGSPVYEWFLNGTSVASTSTYTYAPQQGDTLRVVMNSTYPCLTTGFSQDEFVPFVAARPIAQYTYTDSLLDVIFSNVVQPETQYDWYFGDGSNAINVPNPIHIFSTDGVFTVTLIATNSCGSDTSVQTVYVGNVGIAVISLESLALYPNPTENIVNLSVSLRTDKSVRITWHDAVGKEIDVQTVEMLKGENLFTFDLSRYAKGMYSIMIDTEDHKIIRKVILQ